MNTTELKGNWNEQKAKLKQKFAVLTDNDCLENFKSNLAKQKKNCTRLLKPFNHLLIPKKSLSILQFLNQIIY